MSPSDFCVWLEGFLAVERSTKNIPKKEVDQIKEKLQEVTGNKAVVDNTPTPVYPGTNPYPFEPFPITTTPGIWPTEPSDFARITCEPVQGYNGELDKGD